MAVLSEVMMVLAEVTMVVAGAVMVVAGAVMVVAGVTMVVAGAVMVVAGVTMVVAGVVLLPPRAHRSAQAAYIDFGYPRWRGPSPASGCTGQSRPFAGLRRYSQCRFS